MKEYKYYVDLCGGSCGGVMTIKAKDVDDAYVKLWKILVQGFIKHFQILISNTMLRLL